MSSNCSSSSNDSIPDFSFERCLISTPGSEIFIAFYFTCLLILLPLCILILYLGLQQWRQQRSTSRGATMSHSDSFTYQVVIMELIFFIGATISCWGVFRKNVHIISSGSYLIVFNWYGETFFHILTCVERYLAVIYPVIYMSLRNERGIRIRNICIGSVWLLSIGATSLMVKGDVSLKLDLYILSLSMIIISFCSLCVLCILIRPGPGEQGGERKKVDHSKRRALYTIMVILGVLLLRISWNLVWLVLNYTDQIQECVATTSEEWFSFPSRLVAPLLYLLRAGPFKKTNAK